MSRHVVRPEESLFPLMESRPQSVPFQAHSATSRAAAVAVEPKAGTQRARVLEYLRGRQALGASDFEGIRDLQDRGLPTAANAYRARRIELADAGLAVVAPFKRTSPAGLPCDVWVAKEHEQAAKRFAEAG